MSDKSVGPTGSREAFEREPLSRLVVNDLKVFEKAGQAMPRLGSAFSAARA